MRCTVNVPPNVRDGGGLPGAHRGGNTWAATSIAIGA